MDYLPFATQQTLAPEHALRVSIAQSESIYTKLSAAERTCGASSGATNWEASRSRHSSGCRSPSASMGSKSRVAIPEKAWGAARSAGGRTASERVWREADGRALTGVGTRYLVLVH